MHDLATNCTETKIDVCFAAAAAADLDGSKLQSFLAAGRPEWSAVRWIVVDGVSGDVLQVRQ
jgi:D-alanyl-D-alanine carboxypeptidase